MKQYNVPALEKSIAILDLLAKQDDEFTVTEISKRLEISKATVFMILQVMESHDLVTKKDDGRYSLGSKVYYLGMSYMTKMELRRTGYPFMQKLSKETGFTVHMARIVDNQVLYIEKVEQPSFIRFNTYVGMRSDIHNCSLGKAIAANMQPEEVDKIIEAAGLGRYTPNTITDYDKFMCELAGIREKGYAVEDEEGEMGVRCIGAAVYGVDNKVVGAISITALKSELTKDMFSKVGNKVRETARAISKALGYLNLDNA